MQQPGSILKSNIKGESVLEDCIQYYFCKAPEHKQKKTGHFIMWVYTHIWQYCLKSKGVIKQILDRSWLWGEVGLEGWTSTDDRILAMYEFSGRIWVSGYSL